MKSIIHQGATSVREQIFIADSTVTTGAGKTGLTNASVTAFYFRDGDLTATSITLAAGTVGTWSSGGFKEIDATNLPGWYEVGIPNAVFANVVRYGSVMYKGTGVVPVNLQWQLVPWDPQDAVRLGMTALPNVAAGAAGGVPTATNSSGQITAVAGNVTGSVASVTGAVGSVTGAVGSVTGAVGSVTGAVGSVTGNVGGNVVGSVASVTGAVGSVTGAVASVTGAVGSVTGNVGGNVVGSVASVTAAVSVDLTQAVPTSNTAQSHGDCLNAARAQGFGKWVQSGTTLTLFAPDGITAARTFTLDSATTPTSRT